MAEDVIVALDFPGESESIAFLEKLGELRPYVKIGMELFYAAGPGIVRRLKDRGHKVFLDLKLHDIPNTVGRTMGVLSALGADMLNLHAVGGSAMMRAALEGVTRPDGSRPLLIAVTQLTSTSPQALKEELLIDTPLETTVLRYAELAKDSGLDGVVCSALETQRIHAALGFGFLTVTPGIRFADSVKDDQVRIVTPLRARENGSDYIVVGRPITANADPAEAYLRCCSAFLEGEE